VPRAGLSADVVVAEAARMVDEQGAAALTLAGLAQRFGVAQPSLYKHVDGLADVHGRLAVLAATDLAHRLRDAAVGRAGRDATAAVAAAYRDYARRHPGRYGYLLRAHPEDETHLRASGEVLAVLYGVLNGYGISGASAAVDAARFVRSVLHGFVSLENAGGFAMDRSVDDSFARIVGSLDRALRGWPGDDAATLS
jgi:AcrR family transcriptional regulator